MKAPHSLPPNPCPKKRKNIIFIWCVTGVVSARVTFNVNVNVSCYKQQEIPLFLISFLTLQFAQVKTGVVWEEASVILCIA